jgi:hypothetical protein
MGRRADAVSYAPWRARGSSSVSTLLFFWCRRRVIVAIEQSQHFCEMCDEYTLHERHTSNAPHLAYFLLCIFSFFLLPFCGIGFVILLILVPLWLCHTLIAAMSQPPVRCSVCGQVPGRPTPEQLEERCEARAAALEQIVASVETGVQSGLRGISGFGVGAVRQVDRLLCKMTDGEKNVILYQFVRLLVVALLIGVLIFGLILLVRCCLPVS